MGVVSGQTIGMALRYALFISEEHWVIGDCSISTRLAHVVRYERPADSWILKQYLEEWHQPGVSTGSI
jgi:hypothetical protein